MDESSGTATIGDALRRLRAAGVRAGLADVLDEGRIAAAAAAFAAVEAEVPAFTASGNPEVLPALRQHLEQHTAEVCRLLAGGTVAEPRFVAAYAERAAEQKFPLDALLQAYRQLHRVLAAWVRDAAVAAADENAHLTRVVAAAGRLVADYADAASALLTSEYVRQTRLLAEAEGDRRSELLHTLLDGFDEADQSAAALLRRAGYLEQRRAYCVVAASPADPAELQNPARAQRMVDAIAAALAPLPLRVIGGVRDDRVLAVISGVRRQSGWTAPLPPLAERALPLLRQVGPAALIGLSTEVPSTAHIPRAAREAKLALDFASVERRVVPFAAITLRQMLVAEGRGSLTALRPAWLDAFVAADARARGKLAATLQTYANCNMNVQQTGKALGIHPNTVYARADKIQGITGLNPLGFHALTELLLAIDCRG
jgi:hypothetical protein